MYDIAEASLKHLSTLSTAVLGAELNLMDMPPALGWLTADMIAVDGEVSPEAVADMRHHVEEAHRHLRDIRRIVENEQAKIEPFK
jgi:hypothetical protein